MSGECIQLFVKYMDILGCNDVTNRFLFLIRFIVLCEREAEEETPPPCSLEDELKPPSE